MMTMVEARALYEPAAMVEIGAMALLVPQDLP